MRAHEFGARILFIRAASLVMVFLWVHGCTSERNLVVVSPPSTPTGFVKSCKTPLALNNVDQITQIGLLSVGHGTPVASMVFTADSQILSVAHSSQGTGGRLLEWRVSDRSLLKSIPLGPVNLGGTRFGNFGKVLVTVKGSLPQSKDLDWSEDIIGTQLWDSETGQLLVVLPPLVHLADADISPDLQWILTAGTPGGISLRNTAPGGRSHSLLLWNSTGEGVEKPIVVAFDTTGELFAYGTNDGTVSLEVWKAEKIQSAGRIKGDGRPIALAFDPKRHYLGVLRENSLEIRDLLFPLYLKVVKTELPFSTIGGLTFHPSTDLLGLGHGRRWQLRRVDDLRIMAEGDGEVVTAVAFSPDGCFFAWGDIEGTVHLLGVSK